MTRKCSISIDFTCAGLKVDTETCQTMIMWSNNDNLFMKCASVTIYACKLLSVYHQQSLRLRKGFCYFRTSHDDDDDDDDDDEEEEEED